MKQLFNILTILIIFFTNHQASYCAVIDRTIAKSGINTNAVSVSVKEIPAGTAVYELNANRPAIPASTLKLVTLKASIDTLGKDYEFSTKLYKNTNNELYIKLGADPFLTSSGLNSLMEKAAKDKKIISPKNIYIDDYIFDKTEWGEGWQWDDDLNPLMPKFSSYNIDGNLLKVIVSSTNQGGPAEIYTTKFYPVTFMNLVTTGNSDNIKFCRNNSISPDIISAEGTIKNQITKQLPVNNPKRYFILRLEDAIGSAKIDYYGKFFQKKLPASNIYLVSEIKHPMSHAVTAILKDSSNFICESVFKLAGAKFVNNTGSLESSQKMLVNYLDKLNIDYKNIKIVDGSGVSKNNIITTDLMSDFLVKTADDNDFINSMPTAGEGTLANRMLYFKDVI